MSFQLLDVPVAKYTERTIREMHRLVKAAKTDPLFRNLAVNLTRDGNPERDWKNYGAELDNAFGRLKKVVTYRRDPHQVEWVQHPWWTLHHGYGDCDDMAVLVAAVMGASGAQYRFVTFRADSQRPDDWSHVMVEIYVPGEGWVPADMSVDKPIGFKPQGYPTKEWPEPTY